MAGLPEGLYESDRDPSHYSQRFRSGHFDKCRKSKLYKHTGFAPVPPKTGCVVFDSSNLSAPELKNGFENQS